VTGEAKSTDNVRETTASPTSKCIDWFSEGEAKVVEVNGVQITVRFIGRKGRRGRIAIEAPARAEFRAVDVVRPLSGPD
jgi:hypothetical protein